MAKRLGAFLGRSRSNGVGRTNGSSSGRARSRGRRKNSRAAGSSSRFGYLGYQQRVAKRSRAEPSKAARWILFGIRGIFWPVGWLREIAGSPRQEDSRPDFNFNVASRRQERTTTFGELVHIPSLLPLPRREPLLLFLRPLLSSLVPRFFLLELGLLTPFFFHSAQRSCSLEPCALSRLHRQKEKRRRWRRRSRWEGAPLRRREFLRYRSVASATRQMRISLAVDFLETIHIHTHTLSVYFYDIRDKSSFE